ncbi:MAG: glycerol-3-phosphate 1-O-acyltransferase PlsB [Lautropia sp.]
MLRIVGRFATSVIRPWLRCTVTPHDASGLGIDPSVPLVYALHIRQWSDLVALQRAAASIGLPDPLSRVDRGAGGAFDEASAFFFLTRSGQPSPLRRDPYRYSARLTRLVAAVAAEPSADLQIVPVSVFWGRAPRRDESFWRELLSDGWAVPGVLRQALRVLINGRQTLVRFGEPLRLAQVLADGEAATGLRRVARLLRGRFRHARERAVGPNLSHRDTMIHALLATPEVRAAIDDAARAQAKPAAAIERRARRIAVSIAADFSWPFIRIYDRLLAALWNRLYDGVSVHGIERIAAAGTTGLVYVPCHRSHVDYLLLSYVLYHRGLQVPHVAAGDNLDIPIVGRLLRKGGAFFLRRSFKGDELYAAVFARYLHEMLWRGFPIEYFVEGGRSRTGMTLAPRAGLLAMTVEGFRRRPARKLAFVPVHIGYERLIEGRSYLAELAGAAKRRESLRGALASLKALRSRWGRVHVNVGEPILLEPLLDASVPGWRDPAAELRPGVDALARTIATRINEAAVVHPLALIAIGLLAAPAGAMDAALLARHFEALRRLLRAAPYAASMQVCDEAPQAAIEDAIRGGFVERVPDPLGDLLRVREGEAALLQYVRNGLLHAFALPGLVAVTLCRGGAVDAAQVRARVADLYPALKAEFFLPWDDAARDAHVDALLAAMVDEAIVRHAPAAQAPAAPGPAAPASTAAIAVVGAAPALVPPAPGTDESLILESIARSMRLPIERHYIAIVLLVAAGSGTLTRGGLLDAAVQVARRTALLQGGAGSGLSDRAAFSRAIDNLLDGAMVREVEGTLVFDAALEASADADRPLLAEDTVRAIANAVARRAPGPQAVAPPPAAMPTASAAAAGSIASARGASSSSTSSPD